MCPKMTPRAFVRAVLRLTRHEDGSSDLTVALLLTASGAVMVGLAVPTLLKASDTAGRTFDRQVQILERGVGTGSTNGIPAAGGIAPPPFEIGGLPAPPPLGAPEGPKEP